MVKEEKFEDSCSNCGAGMYLEEEFCEKCGYPVDAIDQANWLIKQIKTQEKDLKNKKLLLKDIMSDLNDEDVIGVN